MTVGDFPLLADANIDSAVVAFLRSEGLDVLSLRDAGLADTDDDTVLDLARRQGRVIVTHDSDFGRMVVAHRQSFVGIVYVRPGHLAFPETIATLRGRFDAAVEVVPPFLIVVERRGSSLRIRYRQE